MAVPNLDESSWPLVRVSWTGEVSADDIDAHFAAMKTLAQRGQRFGLVMSVVDLEYPTAALRKRVAEHLKVMGAQAKDVVVCNAHVVSSAAMRGILTAIYWVSPPPFLTKVFTDPAEAERWVQAQLRAPVG
ncbi:MAG: hypothetical protein AAB426_04015 [Myxococcota bacterium]